MSEKDDCLNERSKLELKHARAVHDIAQQLEKKKAFIQKLENDINTKQSKEDEARSLGKVALANELAAQVIPFTLYLLSSQ